MGYSILQLLPFLIYFKFITCAQKQLCYLALSVWVILTNSLNLHLNKTKNVLISHNRISWHHTRDKINCLWINQDQKLTFEKHVNVIWKKTWGVFVLTNFSKFFLQPIYLKCLYCRSDSWCIASLLIAYGSYHWVNIKLVYVGPSQYTIWYLLNRQRNILNILIRKIFERNFKISRENVDWYNF